VCSDASNINGHMVAGGEASLSQFLFGGGVIIQTRVSFIATTAEFWAKAASKNSPKVSCAVNPFVCSRFFFFFFLDWFCSLLFKHYVDYFSSLQLLII